jgi:predicted nucleotidyltransferase component of viral defense system
MNNSLKQSMKQRLRSVAKERDLTFDEIWHNLILERFLARLCQSKYKGNFILKGGSLLARYIPIGRETKDLDFLVDKLQNTEKFLSKAFDYICSIRLEDGFEFEKVKIGKLTHPHMNYTGIEVLLLAKLGGPQTHIQIDLGFGDIVEAIDYSMNLTSTSKGPLFESKIQVRAYPKEFIFAEKLETVVYRGMGNTRMKDFHDLYSLVSLEKCLDPAYTGKIVKTVFNHRQTSLKLPLAVDVEAMEALQPLWKDYQQGLASTQKATVLPKSLKDLVSAIDIWLMSNTELCIPDTEPLSEKGIMERDDVRYVYLALGHSRLHKNRLVNLNRNEVDELNDSEDHLCEPLKFNEVSKKWEAQYDHDKLYEVVVFYVHGDSGRGFVSHNSRDHNRTRTNLDRAQLGDIFQVPGYFLNDWNNRVDSSEILYYWFQPIATLSPKMRKKVVEAAKRKHPYNTFD